MQDPWGRGDRKCVYQFHPDFIAECQSEVKDS